MNSIDERLKRLQNKTVPTETRKGTRLERAKQELLLKQNGCCNGCGTRFDNYTIKPEFDFPTKKYDYPIGLLCAKCKQIVDNCGRNTNVLQKVINYLMGGKKDQDAFQLPEAKPTKPTNDTNKPTSWSEVKPNE
jgi:hypothetical protein